MADNPPASAPQNSGEFILFQSEDGPTRIEVRFAGETVWLSLNQMADLFPARQVCDLQAYREHL